MAPALITTAPPPRDAAAALLRNLHGIDWLTLLETWGLRLLAAIVIFVAGRWLAQQLRSGLDRVLQRAEVDATLVGFLRNIAYVVMLVLVLMTALTALGVPTTSMFAILGAAGLAVGLALKDSLSNIASGVMLIVLRPFRAGDHVIAAGQEGVVLEIRVFQTRMRAFDDRVIVLPNSQITTAPIINYSALPQRRIEVSVTAGHDDLSGIRELLLDVARNEPLVAREPEPVVRMVALGAGSVDLTLHAFSLNEDFAEARSRVVEQVTRQLARRKIVTPHPRRDVYVHHRDADGRSLSETLMLALAEPGQPGTKPPPA